MPSLASLDFLLGSHDGTDHVQASAWAQEQEVAATSEGTVELSGGVLVQRTRETLSTGVFETLQIFLADPGSDEILLYAFDSAGFPADPPARGRWEDGSLALCRSTPRGQSRTTFTPARGGHGFTWSKEFRPDATAPWQPVVDGEFE